MRFFQQGVVDRFRFFKINRLRNLLNLFIFFQFLKLLIFIQYFRDFEEIFFTFGNLMDLFFGRAFPFIFATLIGLVFIGFIF